MLAVTALPIVTGLIALVCVVMYTRLALGFTPRRTYTAAQKGVVVGLCFGLMPITPFGPVAGMALGFIIGTLIDYAGKRMTQ